MTTTTTAPTTFNLRDLVASICSTHADPDPADLVPTVFKAIDPADYEAAILQMLHSFITTFVVSDRIKHRPAAPAPTATTSPSPSRKVGRPRVSGVAKILAGREFSPIRGQWILLADADVADLRSIALRRREMADAYTIKANWYESLADALVTHSAATVGGLPPAVQEALLT